ncbi:MAG: hypothetical protein ACK5NB_09575 [Flavobacteriaceae bacterium]
MKREFITIQTHNLNNNCPECFSKEGLQLTFKQETKENKFYKAITRNVTHTLFCNTCNTTAYPVQWTDDIERVFNYHQKALTPLKPKTTFKTRFWLVLLISLAVVVFSAIFTYYFKS